MGAAAFTTCCSVASGRTSWRLMCCRLTATICALPFVERKRRLARIMPRIESRLMFLDAIRARGTRLYELACERDLEGIVAKWARGTYQCDGRGTSWLKIKNPKYSQMEGRHELFDRKRPLLHRPGTQGVAPILSLR